MKTLEISCPKCGTKDNIQSHCKKSPMCVWAVCTTCKFFNRRLVVFDAKQRFFIGGND